MGLIRNGLIALLAVACGSEVEPGCKEGRTMVEGKCEELSDLFPESNPEPVAEPDPVPEVVDPNALDLCDGIDNNGNGKIDELGCGIITYNTHESNKVDPFVQQLDLQTGEREVIVPRLEPVKRVSFAVSKDNVVAYAYHFPQKFFDDGGVDGNLYVQGSEPLPFDSSKFHTDSSQFNWGLAWHQGGVVTSTYCKYDNPECAAGGSFWKLYKVSLGGDIEKLFEDDDCDEILPFVSGDELVYQKICGKPDMYSEGIGYFNFSTGEHKFFDEDIVHLPQLHGNGIYFLADRALKRVSLQGAQKTVIEKESERLFSAFAISPDGRSVSRGNCVVNLGSLEEDCNRELHVGNYRVWR